MAMYRAQQCNIKQFFCAREQNQSQSPMSASDALVRVGPWTLQRVLGRGEFGTVFEGVHDSASVSGPLSGSFAIKVASHSGPRAGKSAQSRAAAILHHEYVLLNVRFKPPSPHLPRLAPKDAYGDDGKHRWVAMQLLGETLETRAARASLTWQQVASVMRQALRALRYVHEHGVVYVDVKPENFLFGPAGAGDALFLCDFGLAQIVRPGAAATSNGTPLYSSLAAHLGKPLSPHNDIESLEYLFFSLLASAPALPWFSATSLKDADRIKAATTVDQLVDALIRAGWQANSEPVRAFVAFHELRTAGSSSSSSIVPYDALESVFASSRGEEDGDERHLQQEQEQEPEQEQEQERPKRASPSRKRASPPSRKRVSPRRKRVSPSRKRASPSRKRA